MKLGFAVVALLAGAAAGFAGGMLSERRTTTIVLPARTVTVKNTIASFSSLEAEARAIVATDTVLSNECSANYVPRYRCGLYLMQPSPHYAITCGADACHQTIGQAEVLVYTPTDGAPCTPSLTGGAWEEQPGKGFRCIPAG